MFGSIWRSGTYFENQFVPDTPLYNPHMKVYGTGANEYVSELDFSEFGKAGDFSRGLYNTFYQNRHESRTFDVSAATDGRYHTFTTEWRTRLVPLPAITDAQVVQFSGYWWNCDKTVSFERYLAASVDRSGALGVGRSAFRLGASLAVRRSRRRPRGVDRRPRRQLCTRRPAAALMRVFGGRHQATPLLASSGFGTIDVGCGSAQPR